jgi:hypothetical protein
MALIRVEQIETIPASEISNSSAGNLVADNVQDALDELQGDIDAINALTFNLSLGTRNSTTYEIANSGGSNLTLQSATTSLSGLMSASDKTKLDGIENNATADQDASDVPVTSAGNLLSENVQDALEELQGDIDSINSTGYLTDLTSESILDLTDTPSSFSTNALKILRVNSGATGVEFVDTANINLSSFNDNLNYLSSVDLSIASQTSTQVVVGNTGGTNASLPLATGLLAGIIPATDKAKIDYISVTGAVDLDDINQNLIDLITLSGLPANSTDLGSFTGGIITANTDIKTALQDLETKIETVETNGLQNIVEDTSPQLGGALFSGSNSIWIDDFFENGALLNIGINRLLIYTSSSLKNHIHSTLVPLELKSSQALEILGNPISIQSSSGDVFTWPTNDGSANDYMKSDGSGNLSFATIKANEVESSSSNNLTSTDVQSALEELQGDIDTINSAGYLTQITIDGTAYDEIDTVNFATDENPSGTLQIINGMIVDTNYFNDTTKGSADYTDFAGKLFIPQTPTADRTIQLPVQTIPANNLDLEFMIKGVESGGFSYTVGGLGNTLESIEDGTSGSSVDLLDGILYHFWYDYSANKYYYKANSSLSGSNGIEVGLSGIAALTETLTENVQLGTDTDAFTVSLGGLGINISSNFFTSLTSNANINLESPLIRIKGGSSSSDIYLGVAGGQRIHLLPHNASSASNGDLLVLKDYITGEIEHSSPEFTTDVFGILDNTDNTKKLDFDVSGISTSTIRSIIAADADVDLQHLLDIISLSGVSGGSTNLGTFTGTTIPDSRNIKQALQDLETAVENAGGSPLTTKGDLYTFSTAVCKQKTARLTWR